MTAATTMTKRVYNFSAGPAVLPETVLAEVQRDLLALPGVGSSVLEISHRSGDFARIIEEAEHNLRQLHQIPDNYKVLFLQGGSRLQFSMVPINLLRDTGKSADYILTGSWGKKALAEAKREGPTHVAWDGKESGYDRVPDAAELDLDPNAAYVHFTTNETIEGVQFREEPATGDVPLVADQSSDFISRPLQIERYGLIYACAQKNAGPAGLTIVVMRDDLLQRSSDKLPGMLNYRNHAEGGSCYNTPPTFAVYVFNLVTRWLLNDVGGLEKMDQQNRAKATLLYEVIDNSQGFYRGHSSPAARSLMNVTFRLADDELEKTFLADAESRDLCSLKGHRSVGGIRASIYNAMPVAGVEALCDFMQEFQDRYAK